jgi:Fic family protein
LLKAGYLYVPYCSLERVIEENKDRYYLALRRAQASLYTGNAHIGDWIIFFLQSLRKQVDVLAKKLEREKELQATPKLTQDILVAAREQGRVTVRELQRLTGVSRNTIKAHLKSLVEKRLLTQEGKGKGTWYHP